MGGSKEAQKKSLKFVYNEQQDKSPKVPSRLGYKLILILFCSVIFPAFTELVKRGNYNVK